MNLTQKFSLTKRLLIFLCLFVAASLPGQSGESEKTAPEEKAAPEKKARKPVELVQLPPPTTDNLNEMQKNLARWHMGATLLIPQANDTMTHIPLSSNLDDVPEAILLGDDESIGYELPEGKTSIVVDLGDNYPLNRLILMGYGAKGKISMSTATTLHDPGSRKWMNVVSRQKIVPHIRINSRFPFTEARYVKLDFDISTSGDVGGLGIMGTVTVAQTQFRDPDEELSDEEMEELSELAGEGNISFDYASLYTGSQVSYITSGNPESINLMIDDDFTTFHDFDQEDEEMVLVVDISESYDVDSISLVFDALPGSVSFYFFNALPHEMDYIDEDEISSGALAKTTRLASNKSILTAPLTARGSGLSFDLVRLPEGYFDETKPLFSQAVNPEDERIRFKIERQEGRFLFIRYLPLESGNNPFRVYEISILASIPKTRALLDRLAILGFSETAPTAPQGIPDIGSNIPPLSE